MADVDGKSPQPKNWLAIITATVLGLLTLEEALTKFFTGAPALLTAVQSVIPTPVTPPSPPAQPQQTIFDLADYIGVWHNSDPNTRGISRLWLHTEGSALQLQVWGSCTPADCDWGSANATAFERGVSSAPGKDVRSVEANFKTNFSEVKVTLSLEQKGKLTASYATHFTDNSGRSDFENSDSLVFNSSWNGPKQ